MVSHAPDPFDTIGLMKGEWFRNDASLFTGFLMTILLLCGLLFFGGIIVGIYRYFIPYNYEDYKQHSLNYGDYKKEN